MKKHLPTAGIILIFLAGLAVFLYPLVSDYVNSQRQTRVVFTYLEEVAEIDHSHIAAMLEAAHAFNERLHTKQHRFVFFRRRTRGIQVAFKCCGQGRYRHP
jgi:sortase A